MRILFLLVIYLYIWNDYYMMKLTRLSFNETMEGFSDVHDIKTCLKAIFIQNHFVNCMSLFSNKIQELSSKLLLIWRLGADRLWINPGVRPYFFNPPGATVELGENFLCDSLVPIVARPSAAKVLTAKIGSSLAVRNERISQNIIFSISEI